MLLAGTLGLLSGTVSGFVSLRSGAASTVANHVYDLIGSDVIFLWAAIPFAAMSSMLFLRIPIPVDGSARALEEA